MPIGLEHEIVDSAAFERTIERFRDAGIHLPTISQLADPATISDDMRDDLAGVDPDSPDPRNLFRVHWHNDASRRGYTSVPEHIVLPGELTGSRCQNYRYSRQPVSDDPCTQGARRVRLPGTAPVVRPFRPNPASRGLAFDRKLLPGWCCHFPNPGLPQRCRAARRNEQGALRLAAALGD